MLVVQNTRRVGLYNRQMVTMALSPLAQTDHFESTAMAQML